MLEGYHNSIYPRPIILSVRSKYGMMTFRQFLEAKEKTVKLYGTGTGHTPGKIVSRGAVKPAKLSVRSTYTGMLVPGKIYSREGK